MTRPRGWRSPLGTRRTTGPVNVGAIPFLGGNYKNLGPGELTIIGDAPKSYIVFNGEEREAYIAKQPRREGPIECVTEYLISRIGTTLPLRVAEGRLVRLRSPATSMGCWARSTEGTDDVRFMSRQFLDRAASEQLVHGSQLVGRCFEIDEKQLFSEVQRGQEWRFYTVELIDTVLASAADGDALVHRQLLGGFARMLAFDALIGANDRHAQNWGVIESAIKKQSPRFAPVFDTARGLFWNRTEEKLGEWDIERARRIESYANRSRPLIGFDAAQTAPSHFDLIEHIVSRNSSCRLPVLQVVRAFSADRIARLLHVEFRRLLSRRRLEYIDALLRFRHTRLKQVCDLS